MKIIRPKTDIENQIFNPDYSPRPRDANFSIPESDILDEPLMCFRVNEAWMGHIIGALSALDQPDAWVGGVEEIDNARQQVRKLIGSVVDCMTINDCGDIADCIETGQGGVTDAIQRAQTGVGAVAGAGIAGGTSATGSNCTEDIVFGGVTQLVDYLVSKATDALEIIEVATNFLEVISTWASRFPLVAQLVSPITQYLEWMQETIAENFLAQVTTEYKDALRCELLCLWMDKCPDGMTWSDIADYFIFRLGGTGDILNDLLDMISFVTIGVWDGDDIADVFLLTMVGMQLVNENAIPFINIQGLYELDAVFAMGANNPDNDWTLIPCDPCGEPVEYTYCWFNDGNDPAWTPIISGTGRQLPVYDATNEWFRALPVTINNTSKEGRVTFDLGAVYSSIRIEAHVDGLTSRSSSTSIIIVFTGVSSQQGSAGSNIGTGVKSVNIDHTITDASNITILWRVSTNTQGESETTSYARLTSIKMTVTALVNPLPASNCP